MDSMPTLIEVAAIFVLAGFVKGIVGLGLPTVAIGLLGLMMTPAQAAALLVVPSLLTNIWQSAAGPVLVRLLRRLWPMFLGICLTTWMTASILTGANSGRARIVLGIALVIYAALGLSKIKFSVPPRAEIWLCPLVGFATGLVTGATGIFALPAVPYLQALGLQKDELVQALGLSFTVATAALAVALMDSGVLHLAAMKVSSLALVAALVGMVIGQKLRDRVSPETFSFYFLLGLLLLGGHLALSGIF